VRSRPVPKREEEEEEEEEEAGGQEQRKERRQARIKSRGEKKRALGFEEPDDDVWVCPVSARHSTGDV
jgi:hypothetical protein